MVPRPPEARPPWLACLPPSLLRVCLSVRKVLCPACGEQEQAPVVVGPSFMTVTDSANGCDGQYELGVSANGRSSVYRRPPGNEQVAEAFIYFSSLSSSNVSNGCWVISATPPGKSSDTRHHHVAAKEGVVAGQCLLVALAIRVFYDELSSFHWLLFHHANLNLETEP